MAGGSQGSVECRDRGLSLSGKTTMPRPAIHPGEILADELNELEITPTELSRQISVPPNRISQIIQGKRAENLGRFVFGQLYTPMHRPASFPGRAAAFFMPLRRAGIV